MKNCLLLELKRAFASSGFKISLVFGCAIAGHQVYFYPMLGQSPDESSAQFLSFAQQSQMLMPPYIWGAWLGGDSLMFNGSLFFLILPILAGLPYGASYLQDTKGNYLSNIFTRVKKQEYYAAKWFATFCAGGVAVVLPLVLNFIGASMHYPLLGPYPETFTTTLVDSSLLAQLFFTRPFLYLAIYLGVIFIFAGIYATWCLNVTRLTDHNFLVLLLPFVVSLFLTMFLELFQAAALSPLNFLYPAYGKGDISYVLLLALLLLVSSWLLFFFQDRYLVFAGKDS